MRRRIRRAPRRHAVARDARARARRRSRTSSIAGPRAPTRAPATAPGSSSSCPTRSSARRFGAELPPPGRYGVAVCFLPHDAARRAALEQLLEATVGGEGQSVVGWRDVPVDARHVGATAGAIAPLIRQLFVAAAPELDDDAFERKLYVIRRRRRARRRPGARRAELLRADGRLQGNADRAAAAAVTSPTCATSASRARSRSCIRASRRTPSRAGSSRTRTG